MRLHAPTLFPATVPSQPSGLARVRMEAMMSRRSVSVRSNRPPLGGMAGRAIVGLRPALIISSSWESLLPRTKGLVRRFTPRPLTPWAVRPWHWAQAAVNSCCPRFASGGGASAIGSGASREHPTVGMATSRAKGARIRVNIGTKGRQSRAGRVGPGLKNEREQE
jgi:hypothetical protein